jgi:hypothetical protein
MKTAIILLAVMPCLLCAQITGASVVINEFVASNHTSLLDGDGNGPDWIELYNDGSSPVSLAGWHLTDRRGDPRKWSFPAGVTLGAHGYLVVFASGQSTDDYVDKKGNLHTNFALDADGEYLALTDPAGVVVHEYAPKFPPQRADTSYGVWQDGLSYFAVPTPGRANQQPISGLVEQTIHSHERGFYDEPFDLRISCDTPGATIRYTLDGSEPTEQHGTAYNPNTPIRITTTTNVRSVAYKTGWKTAPVTTHTYIFVDQVAQQGAHPPGWPSDWGPEQEFKVFYITGKVPSDYEMDPRVVNNTLPGYSIRDALLALPTVSITMLPEDFITNNDENGIYSNPCKLWERKCSIEYILPDGDKGFQCDCKIEVHGGASRYPQRMQKHSLRLTFTGQYGPAKLDYPLFPDCDVTEFNQLILRAGFCDSWGLVSWDSGRYRPNDSQYIRDVWVKESLRDMGQPSSYGWFVHLYVNGLYFGLHNLTERVAEDFFASHLGGRPEDWEVNADFSSPRARWTAMMAVDPSTAAGYAKIQEYLDVEDFADYMLLHFYADAEDWPHHNGYAAANAVSGDGKFRFFAWDQELVLDYHGRAASRIDATGGAGALFQKMRTSEEFRLLFADRVQKHCFNDGALSCAASQNRYMDIANWIDKAIVAESARWGDVQMSTPYGNLIEQPSPLTDINHNSYPPAPHGPDYYFTREDSWVVERDNVIQNYIPAIHNPANSYALVNVLRTRGLYPTLDAPVFYIDGAHQHGGPVPPGAELTIENPNGKGTVCYTLDGTDPRLPGIASGQDSGDTLIGEQAAKRVLVPTSDIGQSWKYPAYDDSHWASGTGGVGYETQAGYESFIGIDVETQMYGGNTSCYVRIPFTLTAQQVQDLAGLTLRVRYDDGFVAHLNSVEVARAGFTGTAQWNSAAQSSHADADAVSFVDFDVSAWIPLLREGDNVLAIQALNASATSTDLLLSVELVGTGNGPADDPSISPTALPYTGPVTLIERSCVKARVLYNGQWSALSEATYTIGAVAASSETP